MQCPKENIDHEMVHAKQDMVDHIQIEKHSNGEMVMKEYQIPYDDYYVADKLDDFYSTLDVYGVPHELKDCTPQQVQTWKYYYDFHVKPALDAMNRGETYAIEANIDYLRCEIEAYRRQLSEYGSLMSEAYRESIISTLEGLQRIYEYIKNNHQNTCIMKHLFLYLIIICNGFTLFAQNPFSVKFELVNPSGKIKSDSYFLFTLTNNTDSTYVFTKGVERFGGVFHTYLVRETKLQTKIVKGRSTRSFDFGDKRIIVLKPKESISIRISKFIDDYGYGALPYNKALLATVKKVRYTLVKLQYMNKDTPLSGVKTVDLVSNWVTIDTTEFARLIKTND